MSASMVRKSVAAAAVMVAGAAFSVGALASQTITLSSGSLSASATFAASAGYVDLTLTNLSGGAEQGAANELTGIVFASTADLAGAAQSLYQSGNLVTIDGATTKTDVTDPLAGAAGFGWDWMAANYLSALPGTVGQNGPDLGIINAAATAFGNSLYSGNGSHNPLFDGPVTFRIFDADINADTTFSDVQFRFNTDGLTVVAVPEPETYAMMLAGLGAMGFMARRRRQVA